MGPMTDLEQKQLTTMCSRVFSPSTPVDKLKLFAGRLNQIRLISEAINTRGRHAIIYGDRGVGKTSLANILNDVLAETQGMTIKRVNCTSSDTFRSLWLRMLSEVTVVTEAQGDDSGKPQRVEHTLDSYVHEVEQLGPGEIRRLFQRWSNENFEFVLVFDEFDRLPDEERAIFADTIKDLSDHAVYTTLVLVGVASDVTALLSEHASIDRCLKQILMPLMSDNELEDIVKNAVKSLSMGIDPDALNMIVMFSKGFPHYTHLLGQESTYAAIREGSRNIQMSHVKMGISEALNNTQRTIIELYNNAAQGQRKAALFPQVMLACALAEVDETGSFSSADVRTPLCQITQEEYIIPNFAQHLDKFANDPSRGPILDKLGSNRRFRFRFRNPLLRPFIIMKGLTEGRITGDLIHKLRSVQNSNLISKL